MSHLPIPAKKAIIYEDEYLYICLASFPITEGHVVVVWKNQAPDLQILNRNEYEHLMDTVDVARNTMLKVLNIEKVYLMYMDEINQVHWHLVPRYNEQGFDVLTHQPGVLSDYSLAEKLKIQWQPQI